VPPLKILQRVLFDPGAEMNCISSDMATNDVCVERMNVDVWIVQMGRRVAHCTEAVLIDFDLVKKDFEMDVYKEWFLVWDNPYGIVLGDRFCEQFTTWRAKLASWSACETGIDLKTYACRHLQNLEGGTADEKVVTDVHNVKRPVEVAYEALKTDDRDFRDAMLTRNSDRYDAALSAVLRDLKSRGKRMTDAVIDTSHCKTMWYFANPENVQQGPLPVRNMLARYGSDLNDNSKVANPVTGVKLRHRDAEHRPLINTQHHNGEMSFLNDVLSPGLKSEWRRRSAEEQNCLSKEQRLLTMVNSLPNDARVAFDVAELQANIMSDQLSMLRQIESDVRALPMGLMMGSGAGGIYRRAGLFENDVNLTANPTLTPEAAAHTPAMHFLLQHASKFPLNCNSWTWTDYDEQTYIALQNPDAISSADAWFVEASGGSTNDKSTQLFASGSVVVFKDCKRLPEFNGKIGRLYERMPNAAGKWKIRVLGRNHGQFVTAHENNFVMHVEQRKFVPACDANAIDVGIDAGGMPVEDLDDAPRPVQRQFGREYSNELTRRIKEVLDRYPQLFDGDISTPCTFEPMGITLKPNAILPSRARYYRNTPRMREEVRRQVQEQLDMGIIKRASTPVVSNVLLVKRPHMPGRYRFVIDFRNVNDATEPVQLMMPDIKTQHDRLANKKIFGCVDISSYYRLIELKEDCKYLTGFATDEGTFVYERVAMGLKAACSHAQRVLQDALAADPILGLQGANIRNYFDDIAWGCSTEDEFINILTALMDFGVKHKLKYNQDKSCFGVDSITHVGFIADKDGIRIDPERTRDIVQLEAPKSTKKVQSILGIFNFVRNFIPQFAEKSKFLTDRLDKSAIKRDAGKHFLWTAQDQQQFAELKELVLNAPLLMVLDYAKSIDIRCDSSRFGAGAVLFQYDADGRTVPVCYASRKYTPTETRWSTFQQEMGAMLWSLERFNEYTMGYPVIVETDHRNISYVKRSVMPQLQRWRMRLEAFDFQVHWLCGALNDCADGLSRSAVDDPGIDAVKIHYEDVLPECSLGDAEPGARWADVNVDITDVCYDGPLSGDCVHVELLPIVDGRTSTVATRICTEVRISDVCPKMDRAWNFAISLTTLSSAGIFDTRSLTLGPNSAALAAGSVAEGVTPPPAAFAFCCCCILPNPSDRLLRAVGE